MSSKNIVFIHGAWLTSLSWENFIPFFEAKGYTCVAPEWPYRDQPIETLRQNTPAELAKVGIKELVDHYEAIIRTMPEPPILIGHSFGGLIVQELLDRGVGVAGVGLDSVAPKGVFAVDGKVLKANTKVLLGWGNWKKVVKMSFKEFQYAFTNTFPAEEQRKLYDRYVVPETGRIFFQIAFAPVAGKTAKVNYKNNERGPLLLITVEHDHLVPAHVTRSNYKRYKDSTAKTDIKQFPGRSHLIGSEAGWEEIAGYVADWLEQLPERTAAQTETAAS